MPAKASKKAQFVTTTRYATRQKINQLAAMAEAGEGVQSIVLATGLSELAVRRVAARHDIAIPACNKRREGEAPPEPKYDPRGDMILALSAILAQPKPPPLQVAVTLYGRRLRLDDDCLRLDGRPVVFRQLIRKAMEGMAELGLEPPKDWREWFA